MSLTDIVIGAVIGGIAVALVTTQTGRFITYKTNKAVRAGYAQLVS